MKSKVTVTVLCPSPTRTNFLDVANVKFSMNYLTSAYVAKCGVKAMLKGKWCVTPGISGKFTKVAAKLIPDKLMGKIDVYRADKKLLIERKYQLKQIFQGQIYQLWAQYFCLTEMGYEVTASLFLMSLELK